MLEPRDRDRGVHVQSGVLKRWAGSERKQGERGQTSANGITLQGHSLWPLYCVSGKRKGPVSVSGGRLKHVASSDGAGAGAGAGGISGPWYRSGLEDRARQA